MRKKIVKIARTVDLTSKPIITFDNEDYNHLLFTPSFNKGLVFNKSLAATHAQILKRSAAEANTVCLSSNQINEQQNAMVIHSNILMNAQGRTNRSGVAWIHQQYCNHEEYVTYFNPSIIKAAQVIEKHQQSISFPFLHFLTKRYNRIQVEYINHQHELTRQTLEGGRAWAYQQSWAQLQGDLLFDWRIHHGNISFQQQMVEYFPKSASVVQEYAKDLKKVFKEYPNVLAIAQSLQKWEDRQIAEQEQELPFQADYFRRLIKYYGKEMAILQDRITSGTLNPPKWQRSKKLQGKTIKK